MNRLTVFAIVAFGASVLLADRITMNSGSVLTGTVKGIKEEGIKAALKDGILTISAEHTENNDQKDDNGSYIRRERRYGSFRRSFDVTGIDENAITAAYQNGVLELSLPKAQQVIPEARKILIE